METKICLRSVVSTKGDDGYVTLTAPGPQRAGSLHGHAARSSEEAIPLLSFEGKLLLGDPVLCRSSTLRLLPQRSSLPHPAFPLLCAPPAPAL